MPSPNADNRIALRIERGVTAKDLPFRSRSLPEKSELRTIVSTSSHQACGGGPMISSWRGVGMVSPERKSRWRGHRKFAIGSWSGQVCPIPHRLAGMRNEMTDRRPPGFEMRGGRNGTHASRILRRKSNEHWANSMSSPSGDPTNGAEASGVYMNSLDRCRWLRRRWLFRWRRSRPALRSFRPSVRGRESLGQFGKRRALK